MTKYEDLTSACTNPLTLASAACHHQHQHVLCHNSITFSLAEMEDRVDLSFRGKIANVMNMHV